MKKMMKVTLAIATAGLFCIGLLSGADASAAGKGACADDIAKFCRNIEPGMIPLMECLERHESELTDACKAQEATMERGKTERRERVKERVRFRQACLGDMARFCNEASPTQGGMLRCLNDHEKEISPSCSESIKAMLE